MTQKLTLLLTLAFIAGGLSGCSNTWNGAGKDMKGVGTWMEETF